MAKYEVKRTNLCYMMNNESITDANDIVSFRANVEGNASNYWCGFYDYQEDHFRIFHSGIGEMYCVDFEVDVDETLSNFESKLRRLIYDYCEEWVELVKVADDCSCMDDMKWTPPKKVNGFDWDN